MKGNYIFQMCVRQTYYYVYYNSAEKENKYKIVFYGDRPRTDSRAMTIKSHKKYNYSYFLIKICLHMININY